MWAVSILSIHNLLEIAMKNHMAAAFLSLNIGVTFAAEINSAPSVDSSNQNQEYPQAPQTTQSWQQSPSQPQNQAQQKKAAPSKTQPNLIDYCKEHTC